MAIERFLTHTILDRNLCVCVCVWRVLGRIFGPKRHKVTEERRKVHHEELKVLYSPNSVRVLKSRKVRLAGHVARIGRGEARRGFWWEKEATGETLAWMGR